MKRSGFGETVLDQCLRHLILTNSVATIMRLA
jgi:hypothetical protein